ncbi:hypothetical protein FRC01_003250 [Tulasnella sp. 417]|nr:hypothetical protein FRC01_003250 [Tulasnella sp. 417]
MSVSLSDHCTKGYRLPGELSGEMITIGSFKTYFRKSSSSTESEPSKKALVLFTDIFGLTIPNTQLNGDRLGQSLDVDVYVPDLFEGKPLVSQEDMGPFTVHQPGVTLSFKQQLGRAWALLKRLPHLRREITNRPGAVKRRGEAFIKALKEAKHYDRIGIVGYCFGGGVAIHVAATDLVDTIVIIHPSLTSREEVARIRDMWISAATREQYEGVLRAKLEAQDFEIQVYPGTTHGFAVRPNLEIPEVKQAYEGALQQTTKWLQEKL